MFFTKMMKTMSSQTKKKIIFKVTTQKRLKSPPNIVYWTVVTQRGVKHTKNVLYIKIC